GGNAHGVGSGGGSSVMGARRVPCGGENTSKQPHAGVSIALNPAPVKPAGCSGSLMRRSQYAPRNYEHPFQFLYTSIYEREGCSVSRWLNGRIALTADHMLKL